MANILGLGGVCIDRLAVISRIPDWDEIEHISHCEMQQGGMVATAMVAASRLGEQVEFLGGIGDDDTGDYALECFNEEQVETARVKTFDRERTAFSFVLVHEATGKRTIIHYRGVQNAQNLHISPLDLSGVQFLHLDGYWFETAFQAAQQAKKQGIIVTLDPSSIFSRLPKAKEFLEFIDYFIPSYMFATQFTRENDPFRAANILLQYGCKAVIITKGEEGCFVSTASEHYHLPAFPVSVVDTTGAGDTFHGAFVAGLSKGYDLRQAVQFASAVAALKCTKMGGQSGISTFQETQEFLNASGILL